MTRKVGIVNCVSCAPSKSFPPQIVIYRLCRKTPFHRLKPVFHLLYGLSHHNLLGKRLGERMALGSHVLHSRSRRICCQHTGLCSLGLGWEGDHCQRGTTANYCQHWSTFTTPLMTTLLLGDKKIICGQHRGGVGIRKLDEKLDLNTFSCMDS